MIKKERIWKSKETDIEGRGVEKDHKISGDVIESDMRWMGGSKLEEDVGDQFLCKIRTRVVDLE